MWVARVRYYKADNRQTWSHRASIFARTMLDQGSESTELCHVHVERTLQLFVSVLVRISAVAPRSVSHWKMTRICMQDEAGPQDRRPPTYSPRVGLQQHSAPSGCLVCLLYYEVCHEQVGVCRSASPVCHTASLTGTLSRSSFLPFQLCIICSKNYRRIWHRDNLLQ